MTEPRLEHSKRVLEIEAMKAVAIISMVFVHVFEMSVDIDYATPAKETVAFLIEFFGAIPSAGVFMFAMGWGTAFSKRATAETYLKRFKSLFILGLVINVFEEYFPAILAPDTFGPIGKVLPSILATDIYFFAAFMSLYFALIKKLESRKWLVVYISVVLVAVCSLVNGLVGHETFTTGNVWLDTILGFMIRVNKYSYFPFISWFIFPVAGIGMAEFFKSHGMKTTLIFSALSAAAALGLAAACIWWTEVPDVIVKDILEVRDGEYYALHPVYAMGACGMIALEFLIVHYIMKAGKGQIPNFMITMSKNVAQIYVVQWFIIGLMSPVLSSITNLWINVLLGLLILLASYFGGNLVKKWNLIRV